MPALPQSPTSRPATRPTSRPATTTDGAARRRRPPSLRPRAVRAAADKMCRDVVSAPKDRPVVDGVATVRFLGADGAAIDIECAKVRERREREAGV